MLDKAIISIVLAVFLVFAACAVTQEVVEAPKYRVYTVECCHGGYVDLLLPIETPDFEGWEAEIIEYDYGISLIRYVGVIQRVGFILSEIKMEDCHVIGIAIVWEKDDLDFYIYDSVPILVSEEEMTEHIALWMDRYGKQKGGKREATTRRILRGLSKA